MSGHCAARIASFSKKIPLYIINKSAVLYQIVDTLRVIYNGIIHPKVLLGTDMENLKY